MIKAKSGITKSLLALVIAGAMAAISAPPAAAQTAKKLKCKGCVKSKQIGNNQVKSTDIRDGQVQNADLANDSVTGAKILDGTITGADLAPDSVTGAKILDGTITGADLAPDSVTGAKILDGTITGADLAPGVIPASPGLQRTVVVSPVGNGSNSIANGTALLDTITFLGTVSPPPSDDNPWLIKVEPGDYDVGSSTVELPFGAGMAGAGKILTVIRGQANGLDSGVVKMNDFTELRQLTVFNNGVVPNPVGVLTIGDDFEISDVQALALDGTTGTSIGLRLAPTCFGGAFANVSGEAETVSGTAIGIDANCDASLRLFNARAVGVNLAGTTGQGLIVRTGTVQAFNSLFVGPTNPVQAQSGAEANLIASGINLNAGPVSAGVICLASFELLSFAQLDSTCATP